MPFTKDIGDTKYHAFSTQAPEDPSLAGVADLITGLGKIGFQIQTESAEKELVGQEGAQVPGLEGLGEGRTAPGSEFDLDKALNLRQIKRAREQGILNETQARLKVGQAIRSIASEFPGQEENLRKRAAVFFGKFGEGDLTLTKSAEQKAQESIFIQSFLKPGVAAGIIDATDPFNDKVGQANWQKIVHDRTMRQQTKDIIQTQAEVGQASADQVTSSYIDSAVNDSIGEFLIKSIEMKKSGKLISDTQELKLILNQQKTLHKHQLRTRLSRVKGVKSGQVKQSLEGIDAAYKDLEGLVEDGSLIKMLESKEELLKSVATVYGASKFPLLFAAERVAPGVGTQLLSMSERFASFKSDAQRKAFVDNQPPMMRAFINATLNDPMSISNVFTDALRSNVATGDKFLDNLFLNLSKDGMTNSSETPEKVNGDSKDLSINYYMKHAPSLESLKNLNNASVAERVRKDPKKVAMLTNKFVSYEMSIIPLANAIVNEGKERGRTVEIVMNPQNKFDLEITVDPKTSGSPESVPHFPRPDELEIVEQLNVLNEIVDYYGLDMNLDPHKWLMTTLETINKPIEQE